MKILLQKTTIISPGSKHHLKEMDLLIENEKIISVAVAGSIKQDGVKVISGKFVSPGWFDLHVSFGEPGYEIREDISTGCAAAAQGGFTGVLVMPSTDPPVSGRPAVEYILSRAKESIVSVHVAGTISAKQEGSDLSEMYDMYLAGARVFTDDKRAVQDAGLMTRALLYAQNFGGKIFSYAEDKSLAGKGIVHEGKISTTLGMKGIPSIAEEIMIKRDLSLADYTKSHLHFSTISSKESVELIRRVKAKGMKVTADVSAIQLMCDDSHLEAFDPNYKLKPPLRSSDDRKALIEGVIDGTIDCICSDHRPHNMENKKQEFELASYGAAGLETAFAVARTATKEKLSVAELVSKFTTHARSCAGLKTSIIEEGGYADLTVFDPDIKWTPTLENIKSKSGNNPFVGRELVGKAMAVINKGMMVLCE